MPKPSDYDGRGYDPPYPVEGEPVARPTICEQCRYWEKDYGIWCMNGWSNMWGYDGHCHVEPKRIAMSGKSPACRHGEVKS